MLWTLSQVNELRDDNSIDGDFITAMEYSQNGEMLAVGNRKGHIVVFHETKGEQVQYSLYSGFQSHENEFDCLKSLVIEAKINSISWLPQPNHSRFLLSTNDKCIKLWKMSEKNVKIVEFEDFMEEGSLQVPKVKVGEKVIENTPKRTFSGAHLFQINSISVNSDMETFLSGDDLRINIWNVEHPTRAFNVVDRKPYLTENVSEVITCSLFHPNLSHTFVYGSTKGLLRLCDMRQKALCDSHSKLYMDNSQSRPSSIYDEITGSVSDIKFSRCGKFVMCRDYLSVKVWDLAVEDRPIEVFKISDTLRGKLHYLYQTDSIYDKFQMAGSHNDRFILSGTYNNLFRIYDRKNQKDHFYHATMTAARGKNAAKPVKSAALSFRKKKDDSLEGPLNVESKIINCAWNPVEDSFAVASGPTLFFYQNSSK